MSDRGSTCGRDVIMEAKQVLLARHPETEANVTGRWVGRGNAPFTKVGLVQADAIVAEIVAFCADHLWSSPLERALIPATKAADTLDVGHDIDDRLIEMDFGAAEGLTIKEAHGRGIEFEFNAVDHSVAEGGESRREIMARTVLAMDALLLLSDRPAVVTHGGIFRSALVHLLGLPLDAIWSFNIRNAQIAVITVGDDWARLEEFRQAGA